MREWVSGRRAPSRIPGVEVAVSTAHGVALSERPFADPRDLGVVDEAREARGRVHECAGLCTHRTWGEKLASEREAIPVGRAPRSCAWSRRGRAAGRATPRGGPILKPAGCLVGRGGVGVPACADCTVGVGRAGRTVLELFLDPADLVGQAPAQLEEAEGLEEPLLLVGQRHHGWWSHGPCHPHGRGCRSVGASCSLGSGEGIWDFSILREKHQHARTRDSECDSMSRL